MQEASTSEVCLGDIDGNTLKRLVSYMYGKLQSLDDCQILPLFIAADKYQVGVFSFPHLITEDVQYLLWLSASLLVAHRR